MDMAGLMRLEAAVPLLTTHLGDQDDYRMDSATTALERIGTDAVVRAIDGQWWDADEEFRSSAACLLDHVHADLCVEACLRFLEAEEDGETELLLADALAGQFAPEAIDRVWPRLADLDEEGITPDERDLRYRLVAVATIMGTTFPDYREWHEAALATNWGWYEHRPPRLADAFRPEIRPTHLGNGKKFV
jgi:hypothetical protein